MSHCNIALAGFMGTGKTTVGRLVAEKLGWRFVDTDDVIQARAGRPIAAIFAGEGEAAFRELEAVICQQIAAQVHQVIALGGGALLDDGVRAAVGAHTMIICLTCDLDTVLARVGEDPARPLFSGDRGRLAQLWAARADHYASLPQHLDTTRLTPPQVAEEVVARWMQWQR